VRCADVASRPERCRAGIRARCLLRPSSPPRPGSMSGRHLRPLPAVPCRTARDPGHVVVSRPPAISNMSALFSCSGRQHPGQAVSRPRHDVSATPCCLARARSALAPGRAACLVPAGISAASPGPASLRPALAGMKTPDVLDLPVPGVVAYPGQLALLVMLLPRSRCSQQCRLLRNSAPSRRSFQPLCFSQLSCQREK
jgi:hypothetical protein